MLQTSGWVLMDWIFLLCALAGGVAFLVWIVLQFVGGALDTGAHTDADMNVDADASGHADLSFKLLSFQGIAAFLTMFGLVGLAAHQEAHAASWLSVLAASTAGALIAWLVSKLFSMFGKLQSSGTLDFNNAVGAVGEIYLRVRPGDTGKVSITFQGRAQVLDCISDADHVLESGARVRVIKILNGQTLVVAPMEKQYAQ